MGHRDHRNIAIVLARRSRCVTLYGVNDSWIEPKVAGDRLESVPPCVVRLNALIGHDRPDKIQNPLVAAFRKQRTIARVCNKTQQAEFDQMRMDRDQPERSGWSRSIRI